jgi:hypothetical protein
LLKLPNWRDKMAETRAVAIELAQEGLIRISQKGKDLMVEDLGKLRGPIRLRLE